MTASQLKHLYELLRDYTDWLATMDPRLGLGDALIIVRGNVAVDEHWLREEEA